MIDINTHMRVCGKKYWSLSTAEHYYQLIYVRNIWYRPNANDGGFNQCTIGVPVCRIGKNKHKYLVHLS